MWSMKGTCEVGPCGSLGRVLSNGSARGAAALCVSWRSCWWCPRAGAEEEGAACVLWRFRWGLELYRSRRGATGSGSCRHSEGSRSCRMVETASCLPVGQEPGLRQSGRGAHRQKGKQQHHLLLNRQLMLIDPWSRTCPTITDFLLIFRVLFQKCRDLPGRLPKASMSASFGGRTQFRMSL